MLTKEPGDIYSLSTCKYILWDDIIGNVADVGHSVGIVKHYFHKFGTRSRELKKSEEIIFHLTSIAHHLNHRYDKINMISKITWDSFIMIFVFYLKHNAENRLTFLQTGQCPHRLEYSCVTFSRL